MSSKRVWAAALAAAAIVLVWRPLLLQGLVPVDGNMLALSYPNWSLTKILSASSLLPAWNPLRNMGEPFLADPQAMVLYPPMLLLRGLSDFASFLDLWIVLHTLLAAGFMAALAWRRHSSAPAAAAAAALAGLNGFLTAKATFPNHLAAAAWLPAVLYFQQGLSPLGLGAALALQWLAGFPPFSILSVLAALAWACAQGRAGLKVFLRGAAWAAGLAAAQWIPFLELLGQAARRLILAPATAQEYSLPPLQLLKEALLPQWIHWSPSLAGDPAVVCFYVGLGTWALAAWALRHGERSDKLLGLACATALLLSLGGHLPGLGALPVLRIFRFPANWLFLATACLTLLAASAIARLRRETWQWAAVAILTLDLIIFAQAPRAAWSKPSLLTETPSLLSSWPKAGDGKRIYHSEPLRRVWESGFLETEDDYLLMRDFLAPSFATAFGVAEASSYQTLRLKKAEEYLQRLSGEGPASRLADLAGISLAVVLKPGASRVTRQTVGLITRRGARPRVFLEPPGDGNASVRNDRPGRVEARVEAKRSGSAVLAETDYPGWRVFLDGMEIKKGLFEETFPAAEIPPGRHDVLFVFKPFSVLAGMMISLLTACAFLLSAARALRRA